MADVFDKCAAYPVVQGMVSAGTYPYFRTVRERLGATEVLLDGRRVLLAGGTDYLGLATDPRVVAAAVRATERFGVSCSGPRPLNGTLPGHEQLERRLADLLARPAVAVFTTGYHARLAVAALLGRGDAVFVDQHAHPALLAAAQLGAAAHRRYPRGDLAALDRLLAAAGPDAGKLVITDGASATDGGLCDLPGLVKLARRHRARVLVDGAHDVGLLGPRGRGVAEHFGLEAEVDLLTGTLSTSFGAQGGFLAGPAEVVSYLKHRAQPMTAATALPPGAAAAALAALDIADAEPQRRQRALALGERLRGELCAAGLAAAPSQTPTVGVRIGDSMACLRFWTALLEEGVLASPVIAPAVAEGAAVLRLTATAAHGDDQVTRVLDAVRRVARRVGARPAASGPLPAGTGRPGER